VVAAVVAGLGGGLLISNMVNPHSPKTEMTKLEQRMSSQPIPVVNAPSEPVPYVAATQSAASGPGTVATPAGKQQPSEAVSAAPTQTQPAEVSAPQPAAPVTQAATSEQTKASETKTSETKAPEAKAPETRTTEDAFAKTRGTDAMRDADVRREAKRAEEKRKTERRQQWTERRRNLRRQDQELRDVEQKVREETEPTFAAEPVRMEMRRIRLFDSE
jgi:hypothetical protein